MIHVDGASDPALGRVHGVGSPRLRACGRLVAVAALLGSILVGHGIGRGLATPTQRETVEAPILFVHGNGDSAALWKTVLWRFESNGYPRDRLFAIDMAHPEAPAEDSVPESNRSSTIDQAAQLSAEVTRVLLETGSRKLVLVGSSRGGNTIRNYIKMAGGSATVSIAILCGTPNHGVSSRPTGLDSEWNGQGHFLKRLNQESEVHPGVRFVTLRSDNNDKYAQPTGEALGMPGVLTGVDYDSPALAGAENVVLPGLDHREVAFHPDAFAVMYRVVTGQAPRVLTVTTEPRPILSGIVSGYANGAPTNLPISEATVSVYRVGADDGVRKGPPVYQASTNEDGRWGPLVARPNASYEIVVDAPGYPVTHLFRSPFPRSTRYAHVRLSPPPDASGRSLGEGWVSMSRPRGYFGHGRDRFLLDGEVPEGVARGVPQTSAAGIWVDADSQPSVVTVFNDETIVVRPSPTVVGIGERPHVSTAEFHY